MVGGVDDDAKTGVGPYRLSRTVPKRDHVEDRVGSVIFITIRGFISEL